MKKKTFVTSAFILSAFAFPQPALAMHIMEGFLPPYWCLIWSAISLPFLILGFISIKKAASNPRAMILLALCAAFAFVLSALKIPSVTGSSSHPTGVGLSAVLFGPLATSVISMIVLLFQAILLAHGGLTTLGANTFSMGIAGPFIAFFVFKLSLKLKIKAETAVFCAAFAGNIATYAVTSLQLALAFNQDGNILAAFTKFMGVFFITQLPLAVSEGLLTVVIFNVIKKYRSKELESLVLSQEATR